MSCYVLLWQPFWPSIVMKKWLNIQPKVYEFSEDEVDTETESEDDGMALQNFGILVLFFLMAVSSELDRGFCVSLSACSLKDARLNEFEGHASRLQRNQPVISRQNSGTARYFVIVNWFY